MPEVDRLFGLFPVLPIPFLFIPLSFTLFAWLADSLAHGLPDQSWRHCVHRTGLYALPEKIENSPVLTPFNIEGTLAIILVLSKVAAPHQGIAKEVLQFPFMPLICGRHKVDLQVLVNQIQCSGSIVFVPVHYHMQGVDPSIRRLYVQ